MSTPNVSFEFFPPRSLEASFQLWEAVQMLAGFAPDFLSITYGAGGSTRQITEEAAKTLRKSTGLPVAGHLTCVDATRQETLAVADRYLDAGIKEIVALRGDPSKDVAEFAPAPDGFASSIELIEALSARGEFTIRVGAYPEKHPESASSAADIDWLKAKIDAGASSAITQFFFDPEIFLRFRDACVKAGIDAPIIPGILPVENWANAKRFALRCGTSIPQVFDDGFTNAARTGTSDLFATAVATELCDMLIQEGVDHLHFYTLNRMELTRDICRALGLKPALPLQQVA